MDVEFIHDSYIITDFVTFSSRTSIILPGRSKKGRKVMKFDPAKDSQAIYYAYLLRLWRETPQTPWRILLIATGSQEQFLFSSMEGLFAFLEERIVPLPHPNHPQQKKPDPRHI
jgi:hypothetical protein